MASVHLCVMKLEGDGQSHLEPMLAVSAPQHHRVVELAAVLIGNAVEFRPGQGRCADNDCFIVKGVLTGLADGLCQVKVMGVKYLGYSARKCDEQ